jgi:hypothetical protein
MPRHRHPKPDRRRALAHAERIVAGKCSMEVARVNITAAGRKALAGARRWRTRSDEVSGPLTVKGRG